MLSCRVAGGWVAGGRTRLQPLRHVGGSLQQPQLISRSEWVNKGLCLLKFRLPKGFHQLICILYYIPVTPGRVDSSGMALHYTSQLRRHDAGIMELGLEYTDKMAIPPRLPSFALSGYCVPECTALVSRPSLGNCIKGGGGSFYVGVFSPSSFVIFSHW